MSKLLKRLFCRRSIFDNGFTEDYLQFMLDSHQYADVRSIEPISYKQYKFKLISHDCSDEFIKRNNIPRSEIRHEDEGQKINKYYFLVVTNHNDDSKQVVRVDEFRFAFCDRDCWINAFSDDASSSSIGCILQKLFQHEFFRWFSGLDNTHLVIRYWDYLPPIRRWFEHTKYDIITD